MKAIARRYNLFLALMAMAILCGCHTDKKDKEVSALRVHMESPEMTEVSQTVAVSRDDPVSVTIDKDPVLTEIHVIGARVINTPGGFALNIQFDQEGTWLLEQYSAANSGKHFVIFGQWGDKLADGRWLAAPLITHRIANNVLSFTPDMSREEADHLVLGLNNLALKTIKGQLK